MLILSTQNFITLSLFDEKNEKFRVTASPVYVQNGKKYDYSHQVYSELGNIGKIHSRGLYIFLHFSLEVK